MLIVVLTERLCLTHARFKKRDGHGFKPRMHYSPEFFWHLPFASRIVGEHYTSDAQTARVPMVSLSAPLLKGFRVRAHCFLPKVEYVLLLNGSLFNPLPLARVDVLLDV